jgi:hypothetical protein
MQQHVHCAFHIPLEHESVSAAIFSLTLCFSAGLLLSLHQPRSLSSYTGLESPGLPVHCRWKSIAVLIVKLPRFNESPFSLNLGWSFCHLAPCFLIK